MTDLHGFVPPVIDPDATEFWEGVAAKRLLVPTCGNCGRRFLPPLPCCPTCQSADIALRDATGRGTLYSWIVVHRALDPVFAGAVPYVVAAVTLDEGARLYSRLVDIEGVELRDGLPLELTWIEPEGEPMWAFRPVGGA